AADLPVEIAGIALDRFEDAGSQRAVIARKDQRRVNQPVQQARAGMAYFPGRALARLGIGVEPGRDDPFGGGSALFARSAGREIPQPGETMDRALVGRRVNGAGAEFDGVDGRLDAEYQEM